jgi:hypothetical protein
MLANDYRRALQKATREYDASLAERTRLDMRLAQLAQTIGGLMRLCHLTPTVSLGLTDACRMVLKAAGHPLTAVEVREQLEAMGFDVSRYANDLAAVHTVLKRLNRAGETDFVPRAHNRTAYRWRKPVRVIALSEQDSASLLGPSLASGTSRKKT